MSPRFVLGRENVPCVAEVVYRSLKADCTDFSKKTASCLLPIHTIFANFGRQLKCLLVHIHGGLYLFHYVLDNLNWLVFVFCPI